MMTRLRSTKTFNEGRLQQLQDTMDAYCDAYILRHGNRDMTNYLHVIQAGHIRHQIRRFGIFSDTPISALRPTLEQFATISPEGHKMEGMGGRKEGQRQQMHARQSVSQLEQA